MQVTIDLTLDDDDNVPVKEMSAFKVSRKNNSLADKENRGASSKRKNSEVVTSPCKKRTKDRILVNSGEEIGEHACATTAASCSESSTSKDGEAYIKVLEKGVLSRKFDLNKIPLKEVIPTGRTIKKMTGWGGHWPALREFMQNTIDHLHLLNHTTGQLHAALNLRIDSAEDYTSDGVESNCTRFQFICDKHLICVIRVIGPDELVIEQFYTFPLPPRALDTGVPDTSKQGDDTAGGFGDGFKTAAIALLAHGNKVFNSLQWIFESTGQTITWDFIGSRRDAVGSFAASDVLEVHIKRSPSTSTVSLRENWMQQKICVKGIGLAFLTEAIPRLQVFWRVGRSLLLCIPSQSRGGGDYLADASSLPPISMPTGSSAIPLAGIYIRGIWVRVPKIDGSVMSFCGPRLNVSGRDRNDVDDDDLMEATAYILRNCSNLELLQKLLSPLRGLATAKSQSSSWLLRSPRFLNPILEMHKDFILHTVLEIPVGAIFVSRKTTSSKDPFVSWAANFLRTRDAPLYPLETGSNRHLFEEVSEEKLKEKCVDLLIAEDKVHAKGSSTNGAEVLRQSVMKLLVQLGVVNSLKRHSSGVKVLFSSAVTVPFIHENVLAFPEAPLTRDLIIKILNTIHANFDTSGSDRFTSLVQALFEKCPGSGKDALDLRAVDVVIDYAKVVLQENANFIIDSKSKDKSKSSSSNNNNSTSDNEQLSSAVSKDGPVRSTAPTDLTKSNSTTSSSIAVHSGSVQNSTQQLLQQIARTNKRIQLNGPGKSIAANDFAADGAGTESCMKPNSQLKQIPVCDLLGSGKMYVDDVSARALSCHSVSDLALQGWSATLCRRLTILREVSRQAMQVIRSSVPDLNLLLSRVHDGFDVNTEYEAFYDGSMIIINFNTLLHKLSDQELPAAVAAQPKYPRTLLHEFVVIVTHELAHALDSTGGHGVAWRDRHMSLLQEVYATLVDNRSGQQQSWPPGGNTICQECARL